MSSEREFEDFLRRMTPGRVLPERPQPRWTVAKARDYQQQTHLIEEAMLSGSRTRLEAALLADEVRRAS